MLPFADKQFICHLNIGPLARSISRRFYFLKLYAKGDDKQWWSLHSLSGNGYGNAYDDAIKSGGYEEEEKNRLGLQGRGKEAGVGWTATFGEERKKYHIKQRVVIKRMS